MAKRKSKKRDAESMDALVKWASGVLLIALGLILALGAAGFATGSQFGGDIGNLIFMYTFEWLGLAAYLLPIGVAAAGIGVLMKSSFMPTLTSFGFTLMLLSALTFMGAIDPNMNGTRGPGGMLGTFAGLEVIHLFGFAGAVVLLSALILVGLGIVTDIQALFAGIGAFGSRAGGAIGSIKIPSRSKSSEEEEDEDVSDEESAEDDSEDPAAATVPEREPTVTHFNENVNNGGIAAGAIPSFDAEYNPPPLSLLSADKGKPGVGDIKANANIIKRTFINFGISVEMDEVSVGPTVTRYAIKPAEGVRLSKIVALQQNLELALAAHPVRIEAPIPGKSLVGIEVPNASKAMVGLGGVMSAPEWSSNPKPLLAAIGRDIAGTPHYVNVAKMPHGLIACGRGSCM
jgi:S-DNA-T family DNA segregation ATPase FtsK/SpoIIIE